MCATLRDEFNEPKKSVIGCIDATVPSSNRVVKDLIISREVAQDCEISFANYLYLILKINGQNSIVQFVLWNQTGPDQTGWDPRNPG